MTGQTLLDTMEVLNQELQLQTGEADVTRGLVALNRAQDYFETFAAQSPDILGSGVGTVVTVADTETTAFPSGVLRIDKLHFINPDTNRPQYRLEPLKTTGGHVVGYSWPFYLIADRTGKPTSYYTNGTLIYWNPLPSAAHTIRWYGFQVASDITAGGTFAYPDIVALPIAAFAVKIMKLGVDDQLGDINQLAAETFNPVLKTLSMFNRDKAAGFDYKNVHGT